MNVSGVWNEKENVIVKCFKKKKQIYLLWWGGGLK